MAAEEIEKSIFKTIKRDCFSVCDTINQFNKFFWAFLESVNRRKIFPSNWKWQEKRFFFSSLIFPSLKLSK